MLNKKIKNIIKIFIVLFLLAITLPVGAVMRVNTPNENPIQPMPQDVSANISNNINGSSTYRSDYETSSNFTYTDELSNSSSTIDDTKNDRAKNKPPLSIWYWIISIIIVSSGLFWGFKKLK